MSASGEARYQQSTLVEQPASGQDVVMIVVLLAILLFFLARNMQSFKGLRIHNRPDGKPSESETEGVTTAGEEEEEEEEIEEEEEEDEGDATKED